MNSEHDDFETGVGFVLMSQIILLITRIFISIPWFGVLAPILITFGCALVLFVVFFAAPFMGYCFIKVIKKINYKMSGYFKGK